MAEKSALPSSLLSSEPVAEGIFRLEFSWGGAPPAAGQFFMIRPERTSVFLARPISAAGWRGTADGMTVIFFVAPRGKGSGELCAMRPGETAGLSGPLGNSWRAALAESGALARGALALVAGGTGVAPLAALAAELPEQAYDFYAGFRNAPSPEALAAFPGAAIRGARETVIAAETGAVSNGLLHGRIPAFFDPSPYRAVCACGPEAMLKTVAESCRAAKVPCLVSLERRMACGAGACLGCTVQTVHGNRRCCAEGPVFNAEELIFEN